jgi:hypothetical protein
MQMLCEATHGWGVTVDRSVIFVHSPGFLEEIVRWMCTRIAKFGKNMISIEEEEIRGGWN